MTSFPRLYCMSAMAYYAEQLWIFYSQLVPIASQHTYMQLATRYVHHTARPPVLPPLMAIIFHTCQIVMIGYLIGKLQIRIPCMELINVLSNEVYDTIDYLVRVYTIYDDTFTSSKKNFRLYLLRKIMVFFSCTNNHVISLTINRWSCINDIVACILTRAVAAVCA